MASNKTAFVPRGIAAKVITAVSNALRSIATRGAHVAKVTEQADKANKPALVVLTTEMARYDLRELARVKTVNPKERASALRKIRTQFNTLVLEPLGSNADSSKSLLTQYHRPITHPATMQEWGVAWSKGLFDTVVKVKGGKSYRLSLNEGRARCAAFDKGQKSPLEQAEQYIVRLSKKAKNPVTFIQGIAAICDNILSKVETPKMSKARKVSRKVAR